jgi:hypothetical protein
MYNGKHYIIGEIGLEIFYKDLPPGKTFDQYKSLCLALKGDGWRIPTIEELSYMYSLHTLGVLGFDASIDYYSTSNTPYDVPNSVQSISFIDGSLGYSSPFQNFVNMNVRPVRTVSL